MNNLHISLTEFRNESRVIKETSSLIQAGIFEHVYIAALHTDGLKENENIDKSISVKRFAIVSRKLGLSFLMQLVKYIELSFRLFFYYRKKDIKVINIHALALLPLGIILKRLFKTKLVYDAHELETEKNGLTGFRQKISKLIERRLIKQVDFTIVVGENIADWYASEYDIPRPIVVLNAPFKRELSYKNLFRENLNIRSDQKILLYQGGLAKGRGTHYILDAFKERKDDKVVAVFMGYGELEKEIKDAAQKYPNIYFFPAVKPDVVLNYTSSADIGISLIENTCLSYYYCMPNKLFEYAMAGIPVIASNMKDMSEFITKNNIGTVITDFSPKGVNKSIDSLLDQNLSELKHNAYVAACNHSWEHQEIKMIDAYKKLLNIEPNHEQ